MSLTDNQIARVQSSFENLRGAQLPPTAEFYETLFRLAPEYRSLFRDDLEGQGMKFMSTLAVIVDDLDDPEKLDARFRELGQAHAALGITSKHFLPMEEALMESLRGRLGDVFDADTEAAWRAAYGEVAKSIIEKGGIA